MVDKNLFPYDLAVVAIFKDEGKYLAEWLDYHLLAGVDHFYLYNNDSSDDYAEILAPYVEKNLVTLTDWPGRLVMYTAYNDAIEKYRFECRYMAFIDLDEFIFPKNTRSVAEVVDEILSEYPNAAALGINWQIFGSNGQDKADYSRGVLERFTRRAPKDWVVIFSKTDMTGNVTIKSVVNPRFTDCWWSPHYASYFQNFYSVNEIGARTFRITSFPVSTDKIALNHYYTKSKEEFAEKKMPRGSLCFVENPYAMKDFYVYDHNEEFDDGILKYRAARAENFSLESESDKFLRAEKTLIATLTQCSPANAPAEFFIGKLETFLTCRALAEKFGTKIGAHSAEEYALVWIYHNLSRDGVLTYADLQLFVNALPKILNGSFPIVRSIAELFRIRVLPAMLEAVKNRMEWKEYKNLRYLQRLLNSI